MVITSLINLTIGNIIAPDPIWEERERKKVESGEKLTLSDAIGQYFAPDEAFLAKRYPKYKLDDNRIQSADEFETPNASTAFMSPGQMSDTDSYEDDLTEVRKLTLEACHGTAESLAASSKSWEHTKDFFTLCCSMKKLKESKKVKMKKMLQKHPGLALARSVQLGNMCPDGFSPLHAAAYVGNTSVVDVLLEFASNQTRFSKVYYLGLRDNQGRTALHVSADCGHVEVTEKLRMAMAESGSNPIGNEAPIDLCRRTPLGWALTSKNASATKNRKRLESILLSPGDRSIYSQRPLSVRCSSNKKSENRFGRPSTDIAFGYTDMPGRRINMEDALCHHEEIPSHPNISLFGVFDGHGNAAVSDYVSKNMLTCILSTNGFGSQASTSELEECLRQACLDMDEKLMNELADESKKGGSTGIIALITSTHILVANVGDSRAILVQNISNVGDDELQDESIRPDTCVVHKLSEDHTPSLQAERERIETAGLTIKSFEINNSVTEEPSLVWKVSDVSSSSMLGMSRAFGDFDFKKNKDLPNISQAIIALPEIKTYERSKGDLFLVLACDGIWDVMNGEECSSFILNEWKLKSSGEDISRICDNLVQECFDKGSDDNMTALIVSLHNPLVGIGKNLNFGDI